MGALRVNHLPADDSHDISGILRKHRLIHDMYSRVCSEKQGFNFIKCMDFQGNYLGIPSISHIIIKEILFLVAHFLLGTGNRILRNPENEAQRNA